jgi:hypothetical protein
MDEKKATEVKKDMLLGCTRWDTEEPVINPEINVDMAVLRKSNEEAGRRVISKVERLASLITCLKVNLNNAISFREQEGQEKQDLLERVAKLECWIDFFKFYMRERLRGNEFKDKTLLQQLVTKTMGAYATEDAPDLNDASFDFISI